MGRIKKIEKTNGKSKRAIWEGTISFGLVNIPVRVFSAEKSSSVPFHLMDKRNKARIRYQRINEVTGKKVEWKDVVKAYEYEKGNYVIIDEDALAKSLPKSGHAIDIEHFIDQKSLQPIYLEKPYYLAPAKHGDKGYVLLRETLQRTRKIAVAKVMIRTHQYLAAILPQDDVLILNLLRYPEDIEKTDKLMLPVQDLKHYKINAKEIAMSEELVKSMTSKWDPKKYHNETKHIITDWIEKRIKSKKTVAPRRPKGTGQDNVVDFMRLLKQSVHKNNGSKPHKKKKHSR